MPYESDYDSEPRMKMPKKEGKCGTPSERATEKMHSADGPTDFEMHEKMRKPAKRDNQIS